jgi:hypothetical protein
MSAFSIFRNVSFGLPHHRISGSILYSSLARTISQLFLGTFLPFTVNRFTVPSIWLKIFPFISNFHGSCSKVGTKNAKALTLKTSFF